MWMNLKNIMLSENTWCKRSYILITFIFLFPLVALNLFSLFYSNWYMLYLGVFLFIFILLRVLCTSCICVVVFFVNFRNVRRYFFKYFYPTLSLFSFCNSNNMLNCFTSSCRSHMQCSFYSSSFFFSLHVWILFINLSSSSLTISSMVYNLLISPLK